MLQFQSFVLNNPPAVSSGSKYTIRFSAPAGTELSIVRGRSLGNDDTSYRGNLPDPYPAGRASTFANWDISFQIFVTPTPNDSMLVVKDGRVGIRTTSPTTELEVAGTVKASSFTGNGAGLNSLDAANLTGSVPSGALTSVPASSLTGSVPNAALTSVPAGSLTGAIADARLSGNVPLLTGGKLGLGTSNPTRQLEVQGAGAVELGLKSTDSSGRPWTIQSSGDGSGLDGTFQIIDRTENRARLLINPSGNVGIGTVPGATFHVVGNMRVQGSSGASASNPWNIESDINGNLIFYNVATAQSGYVRRDNGAFVSQSDRRLKKDITELGDVLDRVLKLRPVSYRFKSVPGEPRKSLGFIAQEVEPLFPEVVDDKDGTKGLSYSELVPVSIAAIQELNQVVQEKEARIAELEKQVSSLQALLKGTQEATAQIGAQLSELQAAVRSLQSTRTGSSE